MSSVPFFVVFLIASLAYALVRGRGPERAVAVAYILASAGSLSLSLFAMPGNFRVVPWHLFLVDVLLLGVLVALAIRANRLWLIPAAGCQLVAVMVHITRLIDPAMIPNGYAFLTTIWSWPMVLLLASGTWLYHRRKVTGVAIPDWKAFFTPRRSRMPGVRRPI